MDVAMLIHADHLFDLLFNFGLDLRMGHQIENTHSNCACRAFQIGYCHLIRLAVLLIRNISTKMFTHKRGLGCGP